MRDSRQAPSVEAIGDFFAPESAALHFKELDSRLLGSWTREEIAARRAEAQSAIAGLNSENVFASTQAALTMSYDAPTIAMEHTAAAIYLVRNPLDLAVSLAAHNGLSIDEAIMRLEAEYESENSDQFACEYQGSWSTNVLSWTRQRHAGLHLMRYEDMLSTPENAFGPLVAFLDLTRHRSALLGRYNYRLLPSLPPRKRKSLA